MKGRERQHTAAFRVLKNNLARSEAFIRKFDGPKGRTIGQPSKDDVELLRGSVVFAVGALDAFIHDLILEIVPLHAVKTKELDGALKDIAKEDPGLVLRLVLEKNQSTVASSFRDALERWLSKWSFQGTEKVGNGLAFLGLSPELIKEASKPLKLYTDMRHQIVHRGGAMKIKRAEAQACIDAIGELCQRVDAAALSKFYRRKAND